MMRGKFLFGAASAALVAALVPAHANAQTADPPANASTTARLSADAPVFGELSPAGDTDWYRLSVASGQRYDISLNAAVPEGEAAGFDTLLLVHNADGEVIASNDDANDSLNSALSYRSSMDGEVFVEARGFSEEAAGAYTLRVAQSTLPPDDVGGDAASSLRLTPGRDAAGAIGDDGDQDWFRLSVRSGQIYRIALAGDGADPLGDPLLSVVNADHHELASNDDSNGSLNSYLEYVPAQNGDVYVVAQGYGGTTGSYKLRVDASALPPDNAGNDHTSRARLAIGQSQSGALEYGNDVDFFRTRLEQGQSYRFSVTSPEGDRNFDPMLVVHDGEGAELAVDDDGGDGLNSYLEFTAPSSGVFFLEVRGFSENASGDYVLTANAGDIPASAETDASLSADGDYREGRLSPAGDKDWYRITLAEGQAFRLNVDSADGLEPLNDPLIVLYGPDGAEVLRDDDSGEGLNARLEFTAPAAGAYFLEVGGFDAETAQGRYTISLMPGEIGAEMESAEQIVNLIDPFTSQIGAPGDVDWLAVELVEGRPYRIGVDGQEGGLDPMVRLIDVNGEEVAADDDGGPGLGAYVSYTSVRGGAYYIAVSGFGDSVGAYGVRISDTDVPNHAGTDEYLDAAQGDDRVSRIEIAGDIDSYRVDLEQGVTYEITVVGEGDGPLRDPLIAVLNAMDNSALASDDNSGTGRNARLIFSPQSTDAYFLQVSGVDENIGGYRISIAPQTTRAN